MSLLPSPHSLTLSPLLKGGEGRDEGGAYTHVPCPFGALLVTLYHLKSKAFLRGGHARLRGERQLHITLPSYIQKPFARNWYKVMKTLDRTRSPTVANPRSHIGLGHLAGSPEEGYHIPYIRQARHKEQETF